MNKYILTLLILPITFALNSAMAKVKNCPCGNIVGSAEDYDINGLHKRNKSLFLVLNNNSKALTCKCNMNCLKSKRRSPVVLTSNPPVYTDYICSKNKNEYIWIGTKVKGKVKNSKPMPL